MKSDHDAHAAMTAAAEQRERDRAAWDTGPAEGHHLPSMRQMVAGEASAYLPLLVLLAASIALVLALAAGRVIRTGAEPAAGAASAASAPVAKRVRT